MALFKKAAVTNSYLKMGIMGFAGSGKTYTSTHIAIGIAKMTGKGKPIFFLDTETGSDWIKPRIDKAGLELFTAKTRAFRDLVDAVSEAERESSLLLVDSLTHFWTELCDAYMTRKKRTRLQFEDWTFLKQEWRRFTDLFINSSLHIIVCGRAGFEYDFFEDETGKKQLEKTGIKFKAEGEMGYEPSLLVLMERRMDMDNRVDHHFAKVIKDRSALLDGQEFRNPGFECFLPHINQLNLGGRHMGVDTTRNSSELIPADSRDSRSTQRAIALDEIQSLIVLHHPGQSAEDKKRKLELLKRHFRASWTEMEKVMPLEDLRNGYDSLHQDLEKGPSRYSCRPFAEIDDSLPDHSAPPAALLNGKVGPEAEQPVAEAADEAELLDRYDVLLGEAAQKGVTALQAAVAKLPIEHQAKMGPRIVKKWGPMAVKMDKAKAKEAAA
jgi:AAA domain